MSVYQPKWHDWTPKEARVRTDKTDRSPSEAPKTPSVSFVSAIPGRFRGAAADGPSLHEEVQTPGKTLLSLTDKTDRSPLPAGADRPIRRAVLLAVPEGVPIEWCEGVANLLAAPPHPAWTDKSWTVLQRDAERFLKEWAAQAHRLGWEPLDLFGAHPTAPVARMDAKGLVLLLHGRPVVALAEDGAAIRTGSGGALTYRRHPCPPAGRCLVWELPA